LGIVGTVQLLPSQFPRPVSLAAQIFTFSSILFESLFSKRVHTGLRWNLSISVYVSMYSYYMSYLYPLSCLILDSDKKIGLLHMCGTQWWTIPIFAGMGGIKHPKLEVYFPFINIIYNYIYIFQQINNWIIECINIIAKQCRNRYIPENEWTRASPGPPELQRCCAVSSTNTIRSEDAFLSLRITSCIFFNQNIKTIQNSDKSEKNNAIPNDVINSDA
jgi:hypothetical protein